jgi:hypothetical protein
MQNFVSEPVKHSDLSLQEWRSKRIAERRKKSIEDRDSLERMFKDDPPG